MQSIELKKLNATKDKFFSIIAHDLKGSMGGFMGATEILADQVDGMSLNEIQDFLSGIKYSATNLYRLLENLLHWARVQQKTIPFNKSENLLLRVVTESIEHVAEAARNKNITIQINIPEDLRVVADKNLLQTIVRNLVSNAVKFTPRGGLVSIEGKNSGQQFAEVSVCDNGIGMSPEMLANLFKLDARNGREGTDGEPSTGLGLLLCKEFVEQNGGKLIVESNINQGSKFIFTVPQILE